MNLLHVDSQLEGGFPQWQNHTQVCVYAGIRASMFPYVWRPEDGRGLSFFTVCFRCGLNTAPGARRLGWMS